MKKALIFGILGLTLLTVQSKAYSPYEAIGIFQEIMAKKVGPDLADRNVQMHRGGDIELLSHLAIGRGCSVEIMNNRPLVVSRLVIKRNGGKVFVKTWCADRDQVIANQDAPEAIRVLEDEQCGNPITDYPRVNR
jgi:hypothetical protein